MVAPWGRRKCPWWPAVVTAALCTQLACSKPPTPSSPALTLSPGKDEVSLLFVGDTSVARAIAGVIDEQGAGDPAYPFARMREEFAAHDLVFANLECVLSDSEAEPAPDKTYRIRSATKYASALHDVGIDVVSVANNHAMDFGLQGFQSTLATLDKEGVLAVGALRVRSWYQPVTIVQVGALRVGFLAYNQHGDEYSHPNWRPTSARYGIDFMVDDIQRARPHVDFLVVSLHGGRELSHELMPWQVRGAYAAIDAGADLWVGHHPHVVQPTSTYKGKVIAWSLGDFVFDKTQPWLFDRNRPRLFLKMGLRKEADGRVTATPQFVTGDQEPDTWRPFVAPDAFDLQSSVQPDAAVVTLRDGLEHAVVERVRGGEVTPCDRWEPKQIPLKAHAFRWLAPRFACADASAEKARPWETIAATAELFQGSLKRGIWAHPHAGGVLRFRFENVLLGTQLRGFGGVPDWGIALAQQAAATTTKREKRNQAQDPQPLPVTVRVLVAPLQSKPSTSLASQLTGWWTEEPQTYPDAAVVAAAGLDITTVVPYAASATPLLLDTSALAGQHQDVVVEISGGSGDAEGRFLFDLAVVP